ncbi:hypothetical protein BCR36DRAFT_579949 [Piromyces finnis]|uniref:Uncharacterized protein n=1 Tax=Piromyces finnis TaxID=1754191 RepID=A0A1Y1VLL0_9FUNG|nr:hypothetical protein BCR36DRAFT_579949 [Piromyces finnis]|eukprot:ORX59360.1 hypothetical protein BCR36DRAFT_579949 [Piromyces finnis]
MKLSQCYILLFLLIIFVFNINCKYIGIDSLNEKDSTITTTTTTTTTTTKENKRSINGTSECRPLSFKDKTLKLNYKSISFIFRNASINFISCYFEYDKGLIVCNELTARRIFLFYLPKEVINADYGFDKNNKLLKCNLANSKISNWTLWLQDDGTYKEVTEYNFTKDPKENAKYHFILTFENNCVYRLPIIKVQSVRVTTFSYCPSEYS